MAGGAEPRVHIPIWGSDGTRSRWPSELLTIQPAGSWGPGTISCLDHVLAGGLSNQRGALGSAGTLRPEH